MTTTKKTPILVPRPDGRGALLSGGIPGNAGGTGRPPSEWKVRMEALADRATQALEASKVLDDTKNPLYLDAAKWVQEQARGKAAQRVEHTGKDGGPITVHVSYDDDDAA